jgi:hypothetical protein
MTGVICLVAPKELDYATDLLGDEHLCVLVELGEVSFQRAGDRREGRDSEGSVPQTEVRGDSDREPKLRQAEEPGESVNRVRSVGS